MTKTEFQLWPHQVEALDKLRATARSGKKKIVLQAPPGAGKTEIGAELIKATRGKSNHIAFTVPFLWLVDQTYTRLVLRGVPKEDLGVMQGRHELTNERAPVQIVSVQTLQNRDFPLADVVIVDECHIRYEVIERWKAACPKTIFIGLSATPWARGMQETWDELIIVETISGLIEADVLTPFRTFCPPKRANLSGVTVRQGDYAVGELSTVMQDRELVGDVVETWLKHGERRPTLCFCVDRAHAYAVTEAFKGAGVKAIYVDADTDREDRAEYIVKLETGEAEVICSIGTMTTGVDIPVCSCISFVRPTRSPILFVQALCRGLRAYPGKKDTIILDHSMATMRFGLVSEVGFDRLLPGKKNDDEGERETPIALPRECPMCHFVVPPRMSQCPNCGAMSRPRSGVMHADGELEEIDPQEIRRRVLRRDNDAWTHEEKAQFFGELKMYARMNAYAEGWASHKYKTRFGVWPNAYKDVPRREVSDETLAWIRKVNREWLASRREAGEPIQQNAWRSRQGRRW